MPLFSFQYSNFEIIAYVNMFQESWDYESFKPLLVEI